MQADKVEGDGEVSSACIRIVCHNFEHFGKKEGLAYHREWSLWLNLTQHGKSHQARTPEGLTD